MAVLCVGIIPVVAKPVKIPYVSVPLATPDTSITCESVSDDSNTVAVGLKDGTVALYDTTSKHWLLRTARLHDDGIQSIAFKPDTSTFATTSTDTALVVCDTHTGAIKQKIDAGVAGLYVAYSPDGKYLAEATTGGEDATGLPQQSVIIWDTANYTKKQEIVTDGPATNLSFSDSPERLLISAADVNIYDFATRKRIWTQEIAPQSYASISPDGKIAACSTGLWRISTNKRLSDVGSQCNMSAFTRTTPSFAIYGSEEDGWSMFDGATGKEIAELDAGENYACLAPNGKFIAAGYNTGELTIYKIDAGNIKKQ